MGDNAEHRQAPCQEVYMLPRALPGSQVQTQNPTAGGVLYLHPCHAVRSSQSSNTGHLLGTSRITCKTYFGYVLVIFI